MATRLVLLCAGATASARIGGFEAPGEPLDDGGRAKAAAVRLDGPAPWRVWASPARAAQQTATALGLDADAAPALRDIDHGRWTGRSLAALQADIPAELGAWLGNPAAGTPGGETMTAVVARARVWLDEIEDLDRPILAITHAAVIRAAIAAALPMPVDAAMRIDIAPLSSTVLSFNRCWRLQEIRRG